MRHRMGAVFKTPRSIRLVAEFEELKALKRDSTIFDFEAAGDPPEKYLITFGGNTLVPPPGDKTFPSEAADARTARIGGPQQVQIDLGGEYPRRQPNIQWKTPILHPNIWGGGTVCLGNFGSQWTPYFRIRDLVEILWDMARLAILNPKSAGTGAYNAVEAWDKIYRKFQFPVDLRPLRDKILPNNVGSSMVRPGGDEFDIVIMPDDRGECPIE